MKPTRKQMQGLIILAVLAVITAAATLFLGMKPAAETMTEANSSSAISSMETSSERVSSEVRSEETASKEVSEETGSSKTESKVSNSSAEKKPQSGSSSSSKPASSTSQAQQPPPAVKPVPAPSEKLVVGYYASWGRSSGVPATKLDASLLTHINYAFADISAQNELRLPNSTTDLRNFEDLRTLKAANPHLKTLISVGGWDYSSNFSATAATASARSRFAQSCVNFLIEHGFDGVDLDWEFPKSGDKQNFTLLLQEIRSQLNQLSTQTGRTYYLTIAGSPDKSFLNSIEPEAVASLVDYIFLMGYDMHGPWDQYADFNAPLYPTNEATPHYANSLSQSVSYYKNAGVPAKKIVLGMPFYGYQYTTTGATSNGLFSPFTSAKSVSYDKLLSGLIGNSQYRKYFNEASRVPYLFDGTTFVSYDDESSIAEKAAFAKAEGLGGVGAWELSQDSGFRLLSSAYQALNS